MGYRERAAEASSPPGRFPSTKTGGETIFVFCNPIIASNAVFFRVMPERAIGNVKQFGSFGPNPVVFLQRDLQIPPFGLADFRFEVDALVWKLRGCGARRRSGSGTRGASHTIRKYAC